MAKKDEEGMSFDEFHDALLAFSQVKGSIVQYTKFNEGSKRPESSQDDPECD